MAAPTARISERPSNLSYSYTTRSGAASRKPLKLNTLTARGKIEDPIFLADRQFKTQNFLIQFENVQDINDVEFELPGGAGRPRRYLPFNRIPDADKTPGLIQDYELIRNFIQTNIYTQLDIQPLKIFTGVANDGINRNRYTTVEYDGNIREPDFPWFITGNDSVEDFVPERAGTFRVAPRNVGVITENYRNRVIQVDGQNVIRNPTLVSRGRGAGGQDEWVFNLNIRPITSTTQRRRTGTTNYYDRTFINELIQYSEIVPARNISPEMNNAQFPGNISIIPRSVFIQLILELNRRVGWNAFEMPYEYDQPISESSMIAFNLRNINRQQEEEFRRPGIGRIGPVPLRCLSNVLFVSSDFSSAEFNEDSDNIVEYFKTPDHKSRVEMFGKDGCVLDVFTSIVDLLTDAEKKLFAKTKKQKSIIEMFKARFGDESINFDKLIPFFQDIGLPYEIIDQNNNILYSGEGRRNIGKFRCIYFDGHVSRIGNVDSFDKTTKSSIDDFENEKNIFSKKHFISTYKCNISDYITQENKNIIVALRDFIRDASPDGSKNTIVSHPQFDDLLSQFLNPDKAIIPTIFFNESGPVSMTFKFADSKRNFTVWRDDGKYNSNNVYHYNNISSKIMRCEHLSYYSDSLFKMIKENKSGTNIYNGFFEEYDNIFDYYKIDLNGAYRTAMKEIFEQRQIPIFKSMDECENYNGEEINDNFLYRVRFTNPSFYKTFPLHDGMYYGWFLNSIEKYYSFEVIEFCRSCEYIPNTHCKDILSMIKNYEDCSVGSDRNVFKSCINTIMGIIEKTVKKKDLCYWSTSEEEVENIAYKWGTTVRTYNFGDRNIYYCIKNKIMGDYNSGFYPIKLAIYNQHTLRLLYYYNLLKENKIEVLGCRTDAFIVKKSSLPDIRKLNIISSKDGEWKEESGQIVIPDFHRNIITQWEKNPPIPMGIEIPTHPNDIDINWILNNSCAITGSGGSGKTTLWEKNFPKNTTLVLTLENINTKQWIEKGFRSCTYHSFFGLRVGDRRSSKKEFPNVERVIFEEFSKIPFGSKTEIFKILETKPNFKHYSTYDEKQLEPIGVESDITKEYYIESMRRIHLRMFPVIFKLTSNFRANSDKDFYIRENLEKFFSLFDQCNSKADAKDEIVKELRKYFTFMDVDPSAYSLNIGEDDAAIAFTNWGCSVLRDCIYRNSEKVFVPGCDVYYKGRISINNIQYYSGEKYTFVRKSVNTYGQNIFVLSKDGIEFEVDEINKVCIPQVQTGHIIQGKTITGKLYVFLDSDYIFVKPSWLYQAITRTTSNSNTIFIIKPTPCL